MSLQKYTVQEAQNAGLGQAGYKIIDQAGTATTGDTGTEYIAITIIETDVAAIATTSNDTAKFPNLSGIIPIGTTIFGRWSSVTISGSNAVAICYIG